MATLFTLWTPFNLFASQSTDENLQSLEITSSQQELNPTKPVIGIVVGHWQQSTGTICEDGLTEVSINLAIANMVKTKMETSGYAVYLFEENDLRLINFRGAALIAIYTGSCHDSPENSSGFTIGNSTLNNQLEISNALVACIGEKYQQQTELPFSYQIISEGHPAYHIFRDINPETLFRDINPETPAIQLITGSLLHDRDILESQAETVAAGITLGLLCFLSPSTSEQ
jgi:N-acetylmuramoyl-L-alanine amidase